MTNAEIDALVAEKVMGWQWHGATGFLPRRLLPPDTDAIQGHYPLPHYSTDIAEAWKVVEHLTRQEYEVRLTARPQGALQVVELHRYPVKIVEVYAHIMPTAICLVALRSVGATGEA